MKRKPPKWRKLESVDWRSVMKLSAKLPKSHAFLFTKAQ